MTIFLKNEWAWINNDNATIAIDDEPIIFPNQLTGTSNSHSSRNVQASCNNRGVRSFTAQISDKSTKSQFFETQHVRWRNIMSDHNHFAQLSIFRNCFIESANGLMIFTQMKDLHDSLNNLTNICSPLAQISVLNFCKLFEYIF